MDQRYDLVVVGMGSGGIVAAEFAARIGVRTAVVEKSRVGGDCLWTGCVPSKALLASAKVAQQMRESPRYGLNRVELKVDSSEVWRRIRSIQKQIADTDDNPERYRDLGIEVVIAPARLLDPHTVRAGERLLQSRFILICTGSRPAVPPLPGLAEAGYLTSESVFEIERAPRSVTLIGGGPIAMEMAQGLNRLGVSVTLLQRAPRCLPRDEPELVDLLTEKLRREGVDIRIGVETERVTVEDGAKVVRGRHVGTACAWSAQEIFAAVGRRPNVEGLGLEELGIEVGKRGVVVDDRSRTRVHSVYACGDVVGRHIFTHSAAYEAAQAVRDMFFPGRGSAPGLVPWCTFTDPELAHAGLTTEEARVLHGKDLDVWRADLRNSDRARTEGATEGAVVLVTAGLRMVGAHILAPAAGEMIHEAALAIRLRLKVTDLAGLVHVYPTLSTSIGRLAGEAAYRRARRLSWLVRKTKPEADRRGVPPPAGRSPS